LSILGIRFQKLEARDIDPYERSQMSFRKLPAIAKDVSWGAAGFSDHAPYPSVGPESKYWSLEHFPEAALPSRT
jgi:hypothetical protein